MIFFLKAFKDKIPVFLFYGFLFCFLVLKEIEKENGKETFGGVPKTFPTIFKNHSSCNEKQNTE